jgi:hypothetical protein
MERLNEFINIFLIFRNIIFEFGEHNFSNYYLWYFIDRFGLIAENIKEVTIFTKHKAFEFFFIIFMLRRKIAIMNGNKGKDKYYKMILNVA